MNKITVDFNKTVGTIKPMNAVNNGPKVPLDPSVGQNTGNFQDYKALEIPYARNHDAAHCMGYGGEHIVDIHCIFPDFDADVNDPASYDFELTDKYVETIELTGTKNFYRLGESIEFRVKKYAICVPKDFQKWAEICEHIIRHYNEGWADGFHYGIEYWEIWNEANGDMMEEGVCRRTWAGTPEEFFELYTVAATHLKKCFPDIKIGGPAINTIHDAVWLGGHYKHHEKWAEDFFKYISERKAPLDFFSWHCYTYEPEIMVEACKKADMYLKKYGYENAESILNEWNYVTDFSNDEWLYSLETETNMKGAAFSIACMLACQNTPLDMLMYYDARIGCGMNGLFHMVTLNPMKLYYGFKMFARLRRLKNQLDLKCEGENIYALGAKDGDEAGFIVTYYAEDRTGLPNKTVEMEFEGASGTQFEFYILDENRDGAIVKKEFSGTDKTTLYFDMEQNTVLYIRAKKM